MSSNDALYNFLNKQVANYSVITNKILYVHFNVKGPKFFTIHNELRDDFKFTFQIVDDLAERLLSIGGKPIASLKDFLDKTSLSENQNDFKDADDMLNHLIKDYKLLVKELKEGGELAGECGDSVTEGKLDEIADYLEERIWQYTAMLS